MNVNKPWKNESFHNTFEEADSIRNKLLEVWSGNPKHEGMQVKVKFMSSKNGFAVKTRLHPDFEEHKPVNKKKEKKRGKNSRRNREAAETGKSDTSSVV